VSDDTENVLVPHSDKQEDLIFSDAEETYGVTGTQWGKSQGASTWMKRQIHTFTDPKDNFILAAPSYKIMNQSMLPYFLECMRGYGEHIKSEGVFKVFSGGTVYLRTGTDPDSIVGIPRVRAFWGDEAGKFTLYFAENVRARIAANGARCLYTTSPYSMNWLWKDIIKPKLSGKLPEVKLIRAASWENPYHGLSDPARKAKEQARMDPRRFAMLYGGEFGKMQGLVFDCWDDSENLVDPFILPPGTRYIAGVDWGFTDPAVIKVRAITPSGQQYGISEFFKTGQTIADMVNVARQKRNTYPIEYFVCDPSQPGAIEEFNRNGLTAIEADNDIRLGIDAHYELIKSRKYKEFRGACPNSMDERETYHYPEPEDLGPDDAQKELKPVDANNHTQDTDRYLTLAARNIAKERIVRPKMQTTDPIHAHLKNMKKDRATENW
jgi:phage terminase large subunit